MPKVKQSVHLGEETDAELANGADATWVGVGPFSVYIQRLVGQVVVQIYARGAEDCNPLQGCIADDTQAAAMLTDNAEEQ